MSNIWVVFALLSGLADSFKPLFGKKSAREASLAVVGWAQWSFGLLLLLPVFFVAKDFSHESSFWLILLVNGALNVMATILYWRAIQKTDLSLVLPVVLSATPLFLLVTSPVMLGETPSALGFVGVVIAVMGIYITNLARRNEGFWAPLLDLLTNRGLQLAIAVAGIWSITSNLDRVLIQTSSPVFYMTLMHVLMGVLLFPFVANDNTRRRLSKATIAMLIGTGVFSALALLLHMLALTGGMVPYVLTLKRTSVLFGIAWGTLFFREQHFRQRFVGGLIVLLGVATIILWG